ncbi:hypothetical protein ACFE04_007760 [Oxalis oulophora]
MTLLGWMHRKLKHSSIEPIRDVTKGTYLSAQSPVEDWSCFGSRNGFEPKHPDQEYKNSVTKTSVKEMEDNISALEYEIFHGFLAIGTLGFEPILTEPVTPEILTSSGNIGQGDIEVTENELKLINDKLEKFLEAEAEEKGQNESSARTSYISIVTLNEKPLDGDKNELCEKLAVHPLQGYLYGSSVDLSETTVEKEKGSLPELFQRIKLEDGFTEKSQKNMEVNQPHKFAKHSIKKFFKKLCACSGSPALSTDTDLSSQKKKLRKVMQMFHRKVHPESSIAEKELYTTNIEYTTNVHSDGDDKWSPRGSKENAWDKFCESLELHKSEHSGYNSSGNREHWINSDADCKYQSYLPPK